MNPRQYYTMTDQRLSSKKSRHVVKHEYHDHAHDDTESVKSKKQRRGPRGGVTTPFPAKLHNLLDENLHEDIISWQPHGRCFILRSPKEFLGKVMPQYFKQTKLTSFQRQLNLYGFNRLTSGPDKGGYYHELFLRAKSELCTTMVRMRIKGTRTKGASNPESEPNFYKMVPMPVSSNAISDDEDCSSDAKREFAYVPYESSQVCVSAPGSFESSNITSSKIPDINIGIPMITAVPQMVLSRATSFAPEVYSVQDISEFPESSSVQDDTLFFEGKEFHYLDSLPMPSAEDVSSFLDKHGSSDFEAGLTVGVDGGIYGFDS